MSARSLLKFRLHRILPILALLVLAAALGGCGSTKHPYDATAENNGYYVRIGAVSYQLQISRELNPFSTEDHGYLSGLTASPLSTNQLWYGVFLYAINDTAQPTQVADTFRIVDTQGTVYKPVPVSNPYAWTADTLPPHGTEPGPNSTASFGPTQGALLLFRLNTNVYNNRPLALQIQAPGETRVATISLDL